MHCLANLFESLTAPWQDIASAATSSASSDDLKVSWSNSWLKGSEWWLHRLREMHT